MPYYDGPGFDQVTGIWTVPTTGRYAIKATITYANTAALTVQLAAGANPAFRVRRTAPASTPLISGYLPVLNVNIELLLTLRAGLGNASVTLAGDVELNAGDTVVLEYVSDGLTVPLDIGGEQTPGIVYSIHQLDIGPGGGGALIQGQGNTVIVDQVFGNDATGARQGAPFQTVTAGLAAALPGDTVKVRAGVYNESIVVPAGIGLIGDSLRTVKIQRLLVVANTDLVTMGENSRVEHIDFALTTAARGLQLRGVVFPGTTSATSRLRTALVLVDDTASAAGGVANNLYGVHSIGTGQPGPGVDAIRATTVTVAGIGLGNKRAILVDAANTFRGRDVNYIVTRTGAVVGSYIGAESNNAAAALRIRVGTVAGPTADISQTLGTIHVSATDLVNSQANGLSFSNILQRPLLGWGDTGNLPNNTVAFLRQWNGGTTTSENATRFRFSQKCLVKSLTVRSSTNVTGSVTVVVRKNGVNTTLTVVLAGANTFASNQTQSVSFAAGDEISIQYTTVGATASELSVTVEIY